MQGGGRKKKFAEDEDFDDSEDGSEMSDSEFEDPDEMEVGQLDPIKPFYAGALKTFYAGANGGKEFAWRIICKGPKG